MSEAIKEIISYVEIQDTAIDQIRKRIEAERGED